MTTMVKRKRVVVDVYHGHRQRKREAVEKQFRLVIGILGTLLLALTLVYIGNTLSQASITTSNGNERTISYAAKRLVDINFKK